MVIIYILKFKEQFSMKKIILLFIIFYTTFSFSQSTTNLKVTESPEFKDKNYSEAVLAIHTTNNLKTGLIRSGKKVFLLDVFDDKLNKIASQTLESNNKESFEGYVSFNDEIKFITVLAPSKRERIVYCNTFNVETNKVHKKELFRADVEKGGLFTGRNKRGTNVAISPNGQYIAIATDNIKKNLNSYKVHVFDSETFELIFERSYQEHVDNYFEPNDIFVDDNANLYTLGKLYISGKNQKKDGEANYNFLLYQLSKGSVKSQIVSLTDGNHIASLIISNYDGKINLVGFYSEKFAGNIKGGCNFEIDTTTLEVLGKKNTVLPKNVYEDLYGEAKAERHNNKKKELSSFDIDYIIRDNEGNTFLLAEEFYVTTQYVNTGMNGAGYMTTTYHYDDILILKFDINGDISWGRSVFKRANTPSYNAFLKNNELHIILNSGKNLTEKNDGRTKVSKGLFESSALYDFIYSANGDVKYNKIQDNSGKNFYTPYFGTYNNGKFILISDGGRKKQFMLLE
jgi:hypothetical protein